MLVRRTVHLTTTIALAASVTGWGISAASAATPAVAPASTSYCYAQGDGNTLAAAEQDGALTLKTDYGVKGASLVTDGQYADGSWWAEMEAACGSSTPR